jgi:hypothetical protein
MKLGIDSSSSVFLGILLGIVGRGVDIALLYRATPSSRARSAFIAIARTLSTVSLSKAFPKPLATV